MGVAWTRLGTVTVTAGSVNVSGVDTRWQTAASIGDAFQGPDGKQYEVAAITSDTALQLRTPYQGATAAGQAYAILRIVPQGSDAETMALLRQVLNLTDTQLSAFMAWADSQAAVSISDGETTLPGLHGLRKLMADLAQLFVEIAKRPALTAAGSLGIGMTPSAWSGAGPGQGAVQTMSWAVSCDVNSHYQTNNAFYSGAWTYIGSKCATRYDQDASAGAHKWYSAPSGIAGDSIAFSKLMELSVAGALAVAGPVFVGRYTASTLPSAAAYLDHVITVSNASGGPALCLSNGSAWINVRTNAPVS